LKIVRTAAEIEHLDVRTGLVPTMGAFHEGHLELMRTAKRETDRVVASLFVNPTQFGPGEDFSRYPRDEVRDADLAARAGVDLLFAPTVEEMVADGVTKVTVSGLGDRFEGAHRPGHFDGVATIVLKLFHIVRPEVAYFGKKDLQQCAVIDRMVCDLKFEVSLRFCETVRERDGLAMSSRNAYLSPEHRAQASFLYAELKRVRGELIVSKSLVEATLEESKGRLRAAGFLVDYLDLVNPRTFDKRNELVRPCTLIAAVTLGSTRLIDNLTVLEA
jgi:pantoate--beta-alanine ligase